MARTIRNVHPNSYAVRRWRYNDLPMHQIVGCNKAKDVPRGLYEPKGRGDAWGQSQVRYLKRQRRRALRRMPIEDRERRISQAAAARAERRRQRRKAERAAEITRDMAYAVAMAG
jgi:hypothetical protein